MDRQTLWAYTLLISGCIWQNCQAAVMHGAYIAGDGWNITNITKFKTDTAKPLAVQNIFTTFDYAWSTQLKYQASNIVAQQATPMISLMPVISARRVNLLGEITSGQWNTYLDTWIAGLKSWQNTYPAAAKPTVLIRFAHEFNGNWYPWGNDPQGLKAAWRYIHARFKAAGVTKVEWVWCANNVDVDQYNNMALYYPGDDVVDWTALDGYNWGSNYSYSRWKDFSETFSIPYIKLVTNFPSKPVMLAEVASTEPSDTPRSTYGQTGNNTDASESKAVWIDDMYSRIPTEYPAIRAVAWFNINKELSWAINGTAQNGLANTGLPQYIQRILGAAYTGSFSPVSGGTMVWKNPHLKAKPMTTSPWETWVAQWIPKAPVKKHCAVNETSYSSLPTPVGHALLQQEAEGMRNNSKFRESRLQSRLDLVVDNLPDHVEDRVGDVLENRGKDGE
jgi:mannan endo-1,4-beta-mannosidase